MSDIFLGLLGGVGLFLLGMTLLTDGLRSFAGDSLRRALIRFTDQPVKAFLSGTLATAVVQASSATTITMIGFVSAGLLTFPQALGVVLGASLGSTSTGWLVALIGLNVSVSYFAFPITGVGAFLHLAAPGRWKSFGLALAGFGLMFVGIGHLQVAMEGVTASVNFAAFPAGGLGDRLLIVLVGIVLTVLMQSSGAAIATTLTALNANSVSFDQAALVVIGASIGTTFTGVVASIGASVPARRTALALTLFTIGAGAGAFLTLPLFLEVLSWVGDALGVSSGPIRLAAFHTAFVAVSVAIVLPFTYQFARAVEWIFPDKGPSLTAHLDNSILGLPVVALEAVARVLRETSVESLSILLEGMSQPPDEARIAHVEQALFITQEFFSHIPPQPEHAEGATTRESLLHAMDHLVRLGAYLRPAGTVRRALADPHLEEPVRVARATIQLAREGIHGTFPNGWLLEVEKNARYLRDWNVRERPRLLEETAAGLSLPSKTLHALDTMRWLARAVDHVSRITHYLRERESDESPSEHERQLA